MGNSTERLTREYAALKGVDPSVVSMTAITGSGSTRRYFRLRAPGVENAIGVCGSVQAENKAFLHFTHCFNMCRLPVPGVLWESDDKSDYLLSDNGSKSLFDMIRHDRENNPGGYLSDTVMNNCVEAVQALARIQIIGKDNIDFGACYPVSSVTPTAAMWDLNYFKYSFLKPVVDNIDEKGLETDFVNLSSAVTGQNILTGLQLRDFQSRNILIDENGNLTVIDYQGGRHGMLTYDLASFIWQAKAGFTDNERKVITEAYLSEIRQLNPGLTLTEEEFGRQLQLAVTFRQLQTLGAYGFRGLIQKKSHFITSIPNALSNIRIRIENGELDTFPAISRELLRACNIMEQRQSPVEKDVLTLSVTSFSYHKGYPEDMTGNGGGFVFDCRGMHNPGRYDEYKQLTGLDTPVIEFLTSLGECQSFVEKAIDLVKPTIECYLRRGFNSLSIAFGCTGGQHRSVFCTELFAKKISHMFPTLKINVRHREINR